MDHDNILTIRAQLAELNRQIANLQGKATELKHLVDSNEEAQRTPFLNIQHDRLSPNSPHSSLYHEWCNCRCRSLVSGSSTATIGRGVYLGLVRAGDVANLGEHSLKELDDGLKALAQYLVPRGAEAPQNSAFTKCRDDMIALLDKVSLRRDPVPAEAQVHSAAFRNPNRGRYLRLEDARQGRLGLIAKHDVTHTLYFETFLQLVHFRGIDLEALE
ncbi:hypothetical protein DFP73DRAFT_588824 [Morchella snyderi]|nr:hypothetical protein DFP73DRAFT_588824 [Morchella snyderi]